MVLSFNAKIPLSMDYVKNAAFLKSKNSYNNAISHLLIWRKRDKITKKCNFVPFLQHKFSHITHTILTTNVTHKPEQQQNRNVL